MRLATVSQAKEIDQRTQDDAGLSGELLMESAGCLAAREALSSFFPEIHSSPVAILCGPGNNGGDGLVMARHLLSQSPRARVSVFLLAPDKKRSDLFKLQLKRLGSSTLSPDAEEASKSKSESESKLSTSLSETVSGRARLEVIDLENMSPTEFKFRITDFKLWVDALFGVGFKGELKGLAKDWIDAINRAHVQRLAIDTPSGLDNDTGVAYATVFHAHRTFTFGCAKSGFVLNDGPRATGHVRVLNPGFPRAVLQSVADTHLMVTRLMARKLKPLRASSGNKTKFGHAIVFAGHQGMWGAGVLASTAAYRMGCGYVSLASHDDPSKIVNEHPEILTTTINLDSLWQDRKWKVAAVGPGLGTETPTLDLLKKLEARHAAGNLEAVVVDADAITVAAREKLFPLPPNWILTPHAGELARILLADSQYAEKYPDASKLSREIESNRFHFAAEASRVAGCWVLLKGFRTVVTHFEKKRFWVIGSGNSALAKAGSGDVLTGFIVGLLSQGLSTNRAACLGAFVHGLIADEWVSGGRDVRSLESSDLIKLVPETLSRL